ncbi:MAG: response regulator [Caulobacterales bacterium]|nr:response regulator [Caulobacterales bacterium]
MTDADDIAGDVIVIDDEAAVRQSISALLTSHAIPNRLYESAEAFLAEAEAALAGCVLLDYRMPGMDGVRALPLILERCPAMTVVMITAHADVAVAVAAMKAGAFDFLEKPWSREAFFDTVSGALAEAGRRAGEARDILDARARIAELTPREHDVFEQLVTGAPNKVIAYRLGLSPRTVEFHRARVLEKTGVRSIAELVQLRSRAERS